MTRLWEGMAMRSLRKAAFSILASVGVLMAACQKSESPQAAGAPPAATPAAVAAAADLHPPFGILDVPRDKSIVEAGSFGYGWALDDSGISSVTVSVDGGTGIAAQIGRAFPGVKETYPNFPDNDKAGFLFGIPKAAPGAHTLTVVIASKDGGRTEISRQFQIK